MGGGCPRVVGGELSSLAKNFALVLGLWEPRVPELGNAMTRFISGSNRSAGMEFEDWRVY